MQISLTWICVFLESYNNRLYITQELPIIIFTKSFIKSHLNNYNYEMQLNFYRAVLLGFMGAWLIPEKPFAKLMLNIHELK